MQHLSANTIFLSYICQVNTTKNDENFLSDDIIHALYQLAKTLNKEQKKSLSAIHHHFPRLFLLSHGTSIQYNKIHDGYVVIIHPFSTLQIEHFRLPAPVITGFQFCTKRHLTIKKKKRGFGWPLKACDHQMIKHFCLESICAQFAAAL